MNAVVIGNGSSRLCFNLSNFKGHMTTYGCNALYRDFIPDYLISMDIHMVTEIINARAHYKTKFYTQHMNDIDLLAGNGEPIHFMSGLLSTPDSGTAAIKLASLNGHKIIYMLGFDYHNGGNNNVYAGTTNYAVKNYSTPIKQDQTWKSRLNSIVTEYKDITYIRITNDVCDIDRPNFKHMSIEQFREIIC